jgi:NitT/TauT family transport system substrate-binding protein
MALSALAAAALTTLLGTLLATGACKGKQADESAAGQAGQTGQTAEAEQAGQDRPIPIKLQLNWVVEPEFGGFYAAEHKGFYQQEGLDVDIAAGGAGVQTWKMVATGNVPFAIASSDEIVRARLKDAPIVGLFAVYQTSPRAIMVHESSGVTSLEEVFTSGKIQTVAMEPGLPYGRFLEKKYGFDKVKVIQYGGNLSLFLQDPRMAQQCFIFSEPVSAKQQGVAVKAFSVAEAGYNPYLAVLITSEEFLQKNRPVVEKFVRATRRGWQAYIDEPDAINQYMKKVGAAMEVDAMNLAAELQTPYVVSEETRERGLGSMSLERWQTLTRHMKDLGEIDDIPDPSRCFVNIPE